MRSDSEMEGMVQGLAGECVKASVEGSEIGLPAEECGNRPGGVIPVGQEPQRQTWPSEFKPPTDLVNKKEKGRTAGKDKNRNTNNNEPRAIRDPDRFYNYKNRLDEYRVFCQETMRHLRRRAEICVWVAIHGCQVKGAAQISQKRIAELAGIKGKRHVVNAIRGLRDRGLLEVLSQGRYRPNGADEYGLSSVYRVYPRPELRLLKAVELELELKLKPECALNPGESGASSSSKTSSNPSRPAKPR
jgi:hypothetical protein